MAMNEKQFKRFNSEDHKFIQDNLFLTNKQIGEALGRSESSIAWQIAQMGLSRGVKKWTTQEVDTIREMFKTKTRTQVAKHFNVTEGSIKAVLNTNGIKCGRDGRFAKGIVSPNKGKKMPPGWGGATRFKKGQKPHNTKTDGHITVRKLHTTPYKFIRLSENNWDLLHRVNYRKFIGPIPDEMMVTFKDGNTLNCEPPNLKLESKQEHMARNTIMRFDEELRKTIHLLSKYKRKLKSYEKQD